MSHHHCHHDDCHSHDHDHCCCHSHHHCCDHHHHPEEGDFAKELLEMADDAWMEVLHDKIKEQVIASHSGQLDKLAKLVADTNSDRWKEKLKMKKDCDDFKDKVSDFFKS